MRESTKSHASLETEIRARLTYARRGDLVECLDILEARIDELLPVDTSEMMAPANDWLTTGDWRDETASTAALDRVLSELGLWKVYREVSGVLLQPRPYQAAQRGLRIDRLLLPTTRLLDLGWTHGAIGIECKRSGVKIGPPLAQLVDYSRAVWVLPENGIRVWCDWVFLWSMERQHGPLASFLAQNRIGCARSNGWNRLQLKCGETNLIRITDDDIQIGAGVVGTKVGSR